MPLLCKTWGIILLAGVLICSCDKKSNQKNDNGDFLPGMNFPLRLNAELNENQFNAAREGRLFLVFQSADEMIPVQPEQNENNRKSGLIALLPDKTMLAQGYKLVEKKETVNRQLFVLKDSVTGQVIFREADKTVLQYNYQTVYEKNVIRTESKKGTKLVFSKVEGVYYDEYLKSNPWIQRNDTTTSRIYSVPRSDYIHPLYGLEGEMLTSDWPDGGHPHHRGIFWAWPEVEYGLQRGDIYALQRVFARPTGNIEFCSGQVYAQINAENLWMWENRIPVVNEHVFIRVYRASKTARIVDLTLTFLALKDSVTLATRFANSYGGLNIRMQTPANQEITYFTDEKDANPLRAWSDFSGTFEGNTTASGLIVLQHSSNPEYPGVWRDYPDLAWVQPTFPTPGTRYLLSKEEPLVLRYRLIVHSGGKQGEYFYKKSWDAYHASPVKQ